MSLLAIAQAATAGRKIYWLFPTEFEGPFPFGPFVNRNHFATWVIMALPLSLGYLVARLTTRRERPAHVSRRARIVRAIDPSTAWLLCAAGMMLVALLLSLSRSGVVALGVSAMLTFVLAAPQDRRAASAYLLAGVALVVFVGLAWADLPALRERAAGTQSGLANRMTIWRETMPIVKDFWLTGTGAGTYQHAMYVYQRSERKVFFNQAHNHYLQVAAEGGIVLAGIVALAAALVRGRGAAPHRARRVRARLDQDWRGLRSRSRRRSERVGNRPGHAGQRGARRGPRRDRRAREGCGLRVQGSRFRVQGSGFWFWFGGSVGSEP